MMSPDESETIRTRLARGATHVLGSPVGVAISVALCLGTWSLAYRGSAEEPAAADRLLAERGASAPSDVTITPTRPVTRGARTVPTGPRPVPRLRTPFAPTMPGLEIALQDSDGHSMDRLHAALARARAGQGQARLLFYGASHTAADIYTGYVRNALQTMVGDAGHGFILPAQPWRGYSHNGVRIARADGGWTAIKVGAPGNSEDEQFFGIAGVAIETRGAGATAFVETVPGDGFGSRANHFDVYYLQQPNGGAFDVILDGERVQRVRTNADTRAPGYLEVRAEDGAHRLEIRSLGTGPVRLFGVSAERDVPGALVDVHGINGSRARNQLAWNDAMYREQLRRRNPDLVVLAYGTNESGDDNQPIDDYKAQLEQVVRRIRETVPNASCLLVGPSDRPMQAPDGQWVDRPRTGQIIDTQWRVALENGCAFFDTVAFQGGAMSTVTWAELDPPFAGRDHVHFTRRGYERMGQVLLAALLEGTDFTIPAAFAFEAPEPTDL